MLDFTSALYLGLRHASRELRPWAQFTTGVPAAIASPPGARRVAQKLATLQGCERATLAPSTLHLFWDLLGMFAINQVVIYMDAGVYPIARWGVERAAGRGAPVREFTHHDAEALRWELRRTTPSRVRPVVVVDGFCPTCGGAAPIADYLEIVRLYGGSLVLDDTQALGVLGHSPAPDVPYGWGGGGVLQWSDVRGSEVVVISSLAKGFGVPIALLAGSHLTCQRFEAMSETRVHSSPPSIAAVHAAEHALAVNRDQGDSMRLRLTQLVRHFRKRLAEAGFSVTGGLFPVQTLAPIPQLDAATLHERLLRAGVRVVLQRAHDGHGARISFLITARHSPEEIDCALDALTYVARMKKPTATIMGTYHET